MMTFKNRYLLCAVAFLASMADTEACAEERKLGENWLFLSGPVKSAEAQSFDDRQWRKVRIPHDWSIVDGKNGRPPFDPQAISGQDSGYLSGGTGWYRRHVNLTAQDAAKIIRLNFEAVYMDADIWVNGVHLARHRYGYTAFAVDLTGKVVTGDNVIVVRANHQDPSSRWYAGSGMIRPVTLELMNRTYIDPDSVHVQTPVATSATGKVVAQTTIKNASSSRKAIKLRSTIMSGKTVVAETIQSVALTAGGAQNVTSAFDLVNPSLWSPRSPNLYILVQQVIRDGAVVDERQTRFGIRTVTVDVAQGLRINGETVKLRGGNIHHDNYMLGAAGWPDADRRKVKLMKDAGYNAVRSAHNPASQATLDAADELGMLVVDEAFDMWSKSKKDSDYARFFAESWRSDIDSLVITGRNHPSVILWSIGNEIPEQASPQGAETARQLVQ